MEAKALKRGDDCPNCGGDLRALKVPSAEQWRKHIDREAPEPLPPSYDTATPDQRADLGELHLCHTCGYRTRFPVEAKKAKAAKEG